MKNKVIMFRVNDEVYNKIHAIADIYYHGSMSKLMSSLTEKYFIVGNSYENK